jgi:hypothetical protein
VKKLKRLKDNARLRKNVAVLKRKKPDAVLKKKQVRHYPMIGRVTMA